MFSITVVTEKVKNTLIKFSFPLTFTCSKLTIETLEKGVEFVPS